MDVKIGDLVYYRTIYSFVDGVRQGWKIGTVYVLPKYNWSPLTLSDGDLAYKYYSIENNKLLKILFAIDD